MKKVKMSLYDRNFRPLLCPNNIGSVRVISFTFDRYYKDIDAIISVLRRCYLSNKVTIGYIVDVLEALDFVLEEGDIKKLDTNFKLKTIDVNSVKQYIANDCKFRILINVNSPDTDIYDSIKRYLANDAQSNYDLHNSIPRGSGKSHLNSLMIRDYRELLDEAHNDIGFIFNKQKGGENNMIKSLPNPKRVICSGPVTTVIYGDGSKTHVRKTADDENDYEKAFLLSWLYKTYGKTVVNEKLDEFKEEFNKEVDSNNPKEDSLYAFSAEKISERLNSALTKGI